MTPLTPVENSSNVQAFGYDAAARVLAVHYKDNARVHHYADIDPALADDLAKVHAGGKSVGSWLARHVKHLPFTTVEV
jgi:hypothetical protein